jgi:hypothetical protein
MLKNEVGLPLHTTYKSDMKIDQRPHCKILKGKYRNKTLLTLD